MTRLRRAMTLALCALFSTPLGASALGFHVDPLQATHFVETSSPSADHSQINLFASTATAAATGILEQVSGRPATRMELPIAENPLRARRSSRHVRFFNQIMGGLTASSTAGDLIILQPPPIFIGRHVLIELARHSHHTPPAVPEPATAVLMGIGLAGLSLTGRRVRGD